MKRLVIVSVLVAALMGVSTAQAGIRVEHRTDAVFVLPKHNGVHQVFWVSALRMAPFPPEVSIDSPGSVPVLWNISRGECRDTTSLDSCAVTQSKSIGGRFRDGDIFEFEEDLSSAHLKVTRHGVTHEVSWTATSDHFPIVRTDGCGIPTVATTAGVRRAASAEGRVFGHKMRTLDAGGFDGELSSLAFTC
jgi:hypothetical protein